VIRRGFLRNKTKRWRFGKKDDKEKKQREIESWDGVLMNEEGKRLWKGQRGDESVERKRWRGGQEVALEAND